MHVIAVCAVAGSVNAQEKYEIKVPNQKTTNPVRVSFEVDKELRTKTALDGNPPSTSSNEREGKIVYRETRSAGSTGLLSESCIRWEILEATETINGKKTTLPFQGKIALVDATGNEPTFKIEGNTETPEHSARLLGEMFQGYPRIGMDDGLLPNHPVAVEARWNIDKKMVLDGMFGRAKIRPSEADFTLAVAEGKLVRAYKKHGAQFGVFEINVRVPISQFEAKAFKVFPDRGSYQSLTYSVDGCIDGSVLDWTVTREECLNVSGAIQDATGHNRGLASTISRERSRASIKAESPKHD
jgi:hypothetical protein